MRKTAIWLMLLLLTMGSLPERAESLGVFFKPDVSCSDTWQGAVRINEIQTCNGCYGYIELFVAKDIPSAATIGAWRLFYGYDSVYLSSSADIILHSGGSETSLQGYAGSIPAGAFITIPESLFGNKNFFDKNRGDILLATGYSWSDYVVDYLYYYVGNGNDDKFKWIVPEECGSTVDLHNATEDICTKPDGAELWQECDATEGESNDDTAGATLDHFRIEHDGHALTCQPEEVTVRACLNSDCNSLYTGEVSLTLSPAGWLGGNTQTFSGGNATLWLRDTTPGTLTLGISSSSITAINPYQCYEGGSGGDCTLEYHETGFIFDVTTLTACQDSSAVTIQAVRMDATTQACVGYEGFAGTSRTLNFWSDYVLPASGSRSLNLNGSALATALPGTNVNLNFNAMASATFALNYRDAGQLTLNARYEGSGDEADLVMLGSDAFVVSPAGFEVSATSDEINSLDNSTSSGEPYWPAGENFQAEVKAVCSDGTVTPNFAWDTSLTAVAPFNPGSGTLSNGTVAAASFTNGVATLNNLQYSEVGTMTIRALAGDYLAPGVDVSGTSPVVGRFTPHHFAVSLNTPEFGTGCSSGNFTYIGQVFDYTTQPVITVSAKNKQNVTTVNYTGEWWKITNASLSGKQYSVMSGTLDQSLVPSPDPVIAENTGTGTGTLTFSSGGGMRFSRGGPEADFDAEISLEINVADSDGIVYAANPACFGLPTLGFGMAFENGKAMRYGRLALENAYGSELLNLPVPATIQYFNGTSFVTNTDDSCTIWDAGMLTLTSVEETVAGTGPIRINDSAATTATLSSSNFANGQGALLFSAPGSGGDGWADIDLDLSGQDWLKFDWDGDGTHDNNPAARATFGIFKSNPRLIYQRESVN